jgi:hypothetical protein
VCLSNKFDQVRFVCNVKYLYTRLLNFATGYRHYERKGRQQPAVHQSSSEQLNAASRMRSTAQSIQNRASEEMKHIDQQHSKHLQLIRSSAKDRTIMITRPDHKGRDVAIMDRSDWVRKIESMLQDR